MQRDFNQHFAKGEMMGAKTWMLVYSHGSPKAALGRAPVLDRTVSAELAQRLFPSEQLTALPDGTLAGMNPPDNELVVVFPGVSFIAAHDFALDQPSGLPPGFLAPAGSGTVFLHAIVCVRGVGERPAGSLTRPVARLRHSGRHRRPPAV